MSGSRARGSTTCGSATALRLRVAVVDRCLDARHLQLLERAQLVLGERLGRVEVERAPLRLRSEGVEHGQVERERLPARGARDDRDVLAARGRCPGLRLVLVELLDAACLERRAHPRVQRVRKGRGASLACGLTCDMCELLAFEDSRPRRQLDRHATRVAAADLSSRRLARACAVEVLDQLLEAGDPVVVARLAPPGADGGDRPQGPKLMNVEGFSTSPEQPRVRPETLAMAPLNPLAPALDEVVFPAGLHLPGGVREGCPHRPTMTG